jgi:uncharacterized protein (TIGR04141 family)
MARQRVSLNLYLLKSGVAPARVVRVEATVVDGGSRPEDPYAASGGAWVDTWVLGDEPHRAPLPDRRDTAPALLVRGTPATGGWQSLIQAVVPDAPLGTAGENYGALLFQQVGADVVVWSFGNAWPLIDPNQTVERFGLRVALNALLTSAPAASGRRQVGVRGLTSAIRAAVVRRSTVIAARPAKPTSFERVDHSSDAAAVAEVTTDHKWFDRAAGGRSLRFEAEVFSVADLELYAKEALRLHRRKDYTKDAAYSWIDYTVPVGDRSEIDAVLDELAARATSGTTDIDLVWADADPETYITPKFVCFPGERSGPTASHRTELTWAAAWAWVQSRHPGAPGRDTLRTRLRFFETAGQPASLEVELWQLVVAQATIKGQTYLISDGEVWRASASHIQDIDNVLAQRVQVNPSWLPRYVRGEVEASYNKRAAAQSGHVLLDKQLLRLSGQTPFEPCDVLSADGRFLHVKRKTGSATMSHVVAQALASTQLLRSSADARDLLDAALRAVTPAPARLRELRDHCGSFESRPTAEVAVVIIGSWRGRPDASQLPLLTRISLNSWIRQMPCPAGLVLVGP